MEIDLSWETRLVSSSKVEAWGPDHRLMLVFAIASRDQNGLRVAKEAIDALQAYVDGCADTSTSPYTWVLEPCNDLVADGEVDIGKLRRAAMRALFVLPETSPQEESCNSPISSPSCPATTG